MKFNDRNVHVSPKARIGKNVKIGDNSTIYDHVEIGDEIPEELAPYLSILDEVAHASQTYITPDCRLHVPLFIHEMIGSRSTPVFASAPLNRLGSYVSPIFTIPGTYNYICGITGATMSGSVTVSPGGPATPTVDIVDFAFNPAKVIVGIGGRVTWSNRGQGQHSVVEQGGGAG
jgi:plastocyanin